MLFTTSAVPRLSRKEQLTSSVYCVECKSRAKLLAGKIPYFLLHYPNVKEYIMSSIIFVKVRPTLSLQTIVAILPEEDSPCMVSLVTLATVILISRVWSPGKNTMVVLEVKYRSAS